MSDPSSLSVDIPGYTVGEPLRQAEKSQVFVAHHIESKQQRVVKFVNATEYVAHQIYLSARANHVNLLNIIELGEVESGRYVVTPLCRRGDLADQLSQGMHIQALAKAVKDIARALTALHKAGIVHCDVKPQNVLFSADGVVQLSDFGNCRKIGQSCKNAAGMVSGTAEYMSPEQAAGRDVDERADFYSLGVLLYHALAGELPYKADTPIELGIKHLQDPIPRLPRYLSSFQDIVDKLLTKRRGQRLSDLDEIISLVDAARAEIGDVETTIKTDEITTQEIRIAGGEMLATPRDPARIERLSRRRRRRRILRVSGASMLLAFALIAGVYFAIDRGIVDPVEVLAVVGIGEDPALQIAWGEAQSIHADPNQDLATIVAAYRRVLIINPDHQGASDAITNLNSEWMQDIEADLRAGDTETAGTRLQQASAVFPDSLAWVQLTTRLQNYQRADRLVESTQSLLASHGLSDLPSATAAIQSYQEVLRLAPGHEQAQAALVELALHYANLATAAATQGQVNEAISLLERATAANNTLPMLDDVRELISQATTTQQAIGELLQQARRYRADDQLITPAGENAAELYLRVLATDTNNVIARQGLDEVRAQVTANVESRLASGDLNGVETVLVQAGTAGMNSEFINEIRGRLDAAVQRAADIETYLSEAATLVNQGFLTAPTENNAVAKLRLVQQLDPGNEQANAQLNVIAQRLAEVALEAQQWEMYVQAKQYLDLALTINPEEEEWLILRESWEEQLPQ